MTLMVAVAAQGSEEPSGAARQILQEAGIRGGLVVHLDCGDGRLTTALRADKGFLVHGLDRDAVDVEKARATIRDDGATVGLRSDHGHVGRAGKFMGAKPGLLRLPFAVKHRWAQEIPMFVRAMVLADKTLFIAGPPDLVDEEKVTRALIAPETRKALAEQRNALDGKKGALLWAVSASDGKRLAEQKLSAMPVFDGMIAAAGRIYYTTTDGRIIALGGKR